MWVEKQETWDEKKSATRSDNRADSANDETNDQ
jgi:hypothetical protein